MSSEETISAVLGEYYQRVSGKEPPTSPWWEGGEWGRSVAEKMAPMIAAGKSPWEIWRETPDLLKKGIWSLHKHMCESLMLDPFGCDNWCVLMPETESAPRNSHNRLNELEQKERLLNYIGKGEIRSIQIASLRDFCDVLLISIKPTCEKTWEYFFRVPYWEINHELLSHSLYESACRIIAKRWVELNPGDPLPKWAEGINMPKCDVEETLGRVGAAEDPEQKSIVAPTLDRNIVNNKPSNKKWALEKGFYEAALKGGWKSRKGKGPVQFVDEVLIGKKKLSYSDKDRKKLIGALYKVPDPSSTE